MTTPTTAALKSVRPGPVFLGLCAAFAVGVYLLLRSGAERSALGMFGALLFVLSGWVISLSLHEFAHAFTAFRYGDRSAEVRGYLTLDPRKYTHAGLSIALPLLIVALGGIGFPGGAVYLNTAAFTPAQRTKVSLAGPATNLVLGLALLAALASTTPTTANLNLWAATAALAFLQLSATLLNILPVPGFDGYGALEPHLPANIRQAAEKIAPFGFLILFLLLFIPQLNSAFFGLVYHAFEAFGISPAFVSYGIRLFAFWL
ncbi:MULTISPECIES: site-2 protease family protein [Gordonia]|uniref:site-2 protease family protein n=1 Tax=Gordonia TaxID=2053 RepID=UPI0005EE53FE|nr:site-2 protease family protein [Gordonia sihwensis]KJR07948.1 membrane protein [Gordonia sihwensis]MBY4569594.1 site-2 protease family protein [Gordonia sihwensis]WFN92369.1 site-2 protease family protein [Gordonia sihwensis]